MYQKLSLSFIFLFACNSLHVLALDSDRNHPITIEADSAILDEKKGQTTYKGRVEVTQGSLLLKADIITVSQNPKTKEAGQLSAHGTPAFFEQRPKPDEEKVQAQASTILYFIASEKIELIGNAQLKQGMSQISSDKISYLAKDKIFHAKQDATPSGEKNRVQVTIPAPKKDKSHKGNNLP